MCQSSGISAVWIMSRQLKLYRGQPAQNLNVEHWILQDLVRILQDLVRILQDLVRILSGSYRILLGLFTRFQKVTGVIMITKHTYNQQLTFY